MSTLSDELMTALETVRAELKRLSERVAALESRERQRQSGAAMPDATHAHRNGAEASRAMTPEPAEPISEEIMLVISAAVAAFLGERHHIRQVRLISSRSWAMQGRVSIQASHHLPH
ncbi:MAG: hypothetical protein JO061_24920 [Acidobacteriaceae bacterium]|nr:hypothetical protein [Acidobacteriaceae bacterium]